MGKTSHTLIDASGLEVGLPDRQMGNSEVGHVNLGAGRIVYQDLTRLTLKSKNVHSLPTQRSPERLMKPLPRARPFTLWVCSSAGGVHSHEDHIMAMVELAAERGAEKIYLHAFLDGRDTPPRSAKGSLEAFEDRICRTGQRPRGVHHWSLLCHGPRQPLGPR
ncbi:hypothetical protein ACVXG7_13480 [Enterobacter hormaechei]